ncbi:thiamine-phosphate pyrophosphorylase [Thermaerobacter marianensis DSM 12885]|uniref:Thiamine-phosphate synthase n=1 Tax=Thermaerobacter marianensis (strain ATCC 700841 / DSM 12885 / JCM 10246 / 7p75a) TaxID=644966 RepID=E6SJ40_THEM7|nr:thiamine phosphate synthase [Thermaerobacter marianensis]ADU52064.1 thiamine-phosphate pyrophosphorylase [Thermaerobacter marianensis DSM 12885]
MERWTPEGSGGRGGDRREGGGDEPPAVGGRPGGGSPLPQRLAVYFIYDLGLSGEGDPAPLLRPVLEAGIRAVQLRAKEVPDRVAYRVAVAVRDLTARFGALLIVNDRLDLALAAAADGVHLGQDDLPAEAARRLWPEGLLGVSVRTPVEARAAEAAGADYVGAGALRSTSTKPDSRVIGLEGLAAVVGATRLPVIAIGGITVDDLPALRRLGVAGVAVASAIARAADPRQAAAAFLRAWTC